MVSPAVFAGLHGCGIGTGEEHRGGGKDSVKEAITYLFEKQIVYLQIKTKQPVAR